MRLTGLALLWATVALALSQCVHAEGASRLEARQSLEEDAPHWKDFVPKGAAAARQKSLAEELLEAHERARLREEAAEAKRKRALPGTVSTPPSRSSERERTEEDQLKADPANIVAASRPAKVIKQAARSAQRSVKSYVKGTSQDDDNDADDDDDDEDDDDDYNDEDDDYLLARRRARQRSIARARRRRAQSLEKKQGSKLRSFFAYIGSLIKSAFWTAIGVARWTSRNALWTPMTYIGAALQWSAHTSWRTTRWTGQHAFFGPVRTVTAPLVYLVDGLLFIFVWLPARGLRVVIRELYPVYVFLGAGLAIGTGMGIIAALVIFVGSFIFGDDSKMEQGLARRGEELPRKWEEEILRSQRRDRIQRSDHAASRETKGNSSSALSNPANASRRRSKGVVERALEDSMRREDQTRRQSGTRRASNIAPESDEEDDRDLDRRQRDGPSDYFFGYSGLPHGGSTRKDASNKGKGKAKEAVRRSSYGTGATPNGTGNTQAPGLSPLGYPLPYGVTAQGGWSSRAEANSSVPASSPPFGRGSLTGGTNSNSSTPVNPTAPLPVLTPSSGGTYDTTSRSTSLRQRRNVAT